MFNISKIIDVYGWAYDYVGRDMAKYSQSKIINQLYNQVNYDRQDIMWISSPNISYSESAIKIPQEAHKKGLKVIGGYCGEVSLIYSYADLIITISPTLYLWAKQQYKNIPVIWLPEGIDVNYFNPSEHSRRRFTPGWCGGANKQIKRTHLFSRLKYPVKIQSEHGKQFFIKGRTQDHMKEFFNDIDCFISLSETECLSRSILEAMASGLPIISTDVGAIHLMIPDEWIISTFSEEKCVEEANKKLIELCESYELRDALGKINRVWAEKVWAWNVLMPIYDEIFYYLSKGDINKILEIGDNVIEPFKKYFTMNEDYEKQISRFSRFKVEQNQVVPNPYEHIISNVIEELEKNGFYYWVSKESCLDTVHRGRITTIKDHLHLGVKTEDEKIKILEYLGKRGAIITQDLAVIRGLNIHVNIESISDTKPMALYNKAIKVPYPVVPYLSSKFGHNWERK